MKFKFKHPWSVIDRAIPGDARKTDNDFHNACNYGSYERRNCERRQIPENHCQSCSKGKEISPIEVSRQKSGCDLWIIIIPRSQSVRSSITSARYLLFILFWRLWLDDFLSPKKKSKHHPTNKPISGIIQCLPSKFMFGFFFVNIIISHSL